MNKIKDVVTKVYTKQGRRSSDLPPYQAFNSSVSKYFSRCLYMMFALVWMHFEVSFHISKPFGFSNIRRRWNGAMSFGPWYLILTLVIAWVLFHPVWHTCSDFLQFSSRIGIASMYSNRASIIDITIFLKYISHKKGQNKSNSSISATFTG